MFVECHSSDDPGETKTGVESTTKDIFNLNMVPRVVGEQYLLPRNAWVCCDDCFKWRRIPATLADSIEETNCIWYATMLIPVPPCKLAINTVVVISVILSFTFSELFYIFTVYSVSTYKKRYLVFDFLSICSTWPII